jgi:hypothetical protein
MKLQVHLTHKDEDNCDFYRTFVGHITVSDTLDLSTPQGYHEAREMACETLKDCYYSDFTSVHFAPVGTKVKRHGPLSAGAVNFLWSVVRETERSENA